MSDPTTAVRPEVETFVAEVRARLADLSQEQREDLLDGLEADLSDQLADGADLGDPASYAAELRAAAGLPEGRRPRVPRLPTLRLPRPEELVAALDRDREQWFSAVDRHEATRQAWAVASALRPAWWVARAWVAVTALDQVVGPWEHASLAPSLGVPLLGVAVLTVAIVVSTLIGLGRLWPGSGPHRPVTARLVLLVANVAAVLLPLTFTINGPGYLTATPVHADMVGRSGPAPKTHGLVLDGKPVRNVFAYDAAGQPLAGVQLFAADGRALTVPPDTAVHGPRRADRTVGCGWLNGSSRLFNVFPLAQRPQSMNTCAVEVPEAGPITPAVPPYAQVPPVTSPVPAP